MMVLCAIASIGDSNIATVVTVELPADESAESDVSGELSESEELFDESGELGEADEKGEDSELGGMQKLYFFWLPKTSRLKFDFIPRIKPCLRSPFASVPINTQFGMPLLWYNDPLFIHFSITALEIFRSFARYAVTLLLSSFAAGGTNSCFS